MSGGNERRQVLRKGGKSPDRVRSCLLYWPSPTHHPKLELFESQITIIEENWVKKENDIKELLKKNEADERNSLKKGNILKRIENLEKLNDEKDQTLKFLVDKVNTLENKS